MVACKGRPGNSYFDYFIGTKAQCEEWLEGVDPLVYTEILTNKDAKQWRYRDGTKVVEF